MRWLFFVLVLINLVAAYWFYSTAAFRAEQVDSQKNELSAHQEKEKYAPLLLVDEMPGLTEEADESQSVSDNPLASTADNVLSSGNGGGLRCLLIGPLDEIDAEELHRRLLSHGFGGELVWRTTRIRENHWLIVPPLASRVEASKMLKDLRSKEIDSFLIAEGEYKNGITLGVFSDRDNIEHYRHKLVTQGYPVVVVPRPATVEERWLQLRQYTLQSAPKGLMELIDEEDKNTSRRMTEDTCVSSGSAE